MHIPDYIAALEEEHRNHVALGLTEQARQVLAELERVRPKKKAPPTRETTAKAKASETR